MQELNGVVFCAKEENDLISAIRQSGREPTLAKCFGDAVRAAAQGGSVFLLADDYPAKGPELTEDMLAMARAKGVKLYIEYPERVLGVKTGAPQTIEYERLIAPDGFFGRMEKRALLTLNGCWHRPWHKKGPGLLCLAKVAGYDTVAYDFPERYAVILDWLDEKKDVLIATSCLSSFIRGRYAPASRWRALWEALLCEMGAGRVSLQWEKDVTTEAEKDEPLSDGANRRAWARNAEWALKYMIGKTSPIVTVFEGYESAIDYRGRQFLRGVCRGDCMGEIAMELAYAWRQTANPETKRLCEKIVDHVLEPGVFYHDDPDSAMYGLNNWFENADIFYGDDNARVLLGLLSVRDLLGEKRWDERILRCAFANLRTSDRNGLRRPRLEASSFANRSWTDYYNEETDYVSPHYQAYLWAAFLWLYALTGIDELLEKSEKAIAMVMERFPDQLRWQNSLTGEIARMLLPLSFLARVSPTPTHSRWLRQAIDAMIAWQQPCGAIRDAFGDFALGKYPPPQSHERYGTSEASLIQENGDPATDLLYTANWAFIGFWEASRTLGAAYLQPYEKLRDFLIRAQVRSRKHPELDGAWMRGFDYEKWEYWGSTADIGWSAWSIESGWVNAWIATTLILEERGESLMRLSPDEGFRSAALTIYREMMTPCETRETVHAGQKSLAGSAE